MNITVVRQLGGIGDYLMLSPVFLGLKEKYPDSKITLISSTRGYPGGVLLHLASRIPQIDTVLDVDPARLTTEETKTWIEAAAGANVLTPPPTGRLFIDLNCPCKAYEHGQLRLGLPIEKHRTQIWCERAEVTPSSLKPIYNFTSEELRTAKAYGRRESWDHKTIACCFTASAEARSLNEAQERNMLSVIRGAGYRPVLVGSTRPPQSGFEELRDVPFADMFALLTQFGAVVSVDSGLLHMAGTVGTPVVGLFGSTDPKTRMTHYVGEAIGPAHALPCAPCWYALPCLRGDSASHFKCMSLLSPSRVVETLSKYC